MRGSGNESARPVLVVGMPRSGTTLAEQILAAHPAVFGAGELLYWGSTAVRKAASQLIRGGAGKSLRDLADDYLRLLAIRSPEALRVVDKLPNNFIRLALIHAALPNARIIHMRRDPIDTCLSIYFQDFHVTNTFANSLDDLSHYYLEYLRLMAHWRSILPAERLLEVPYEGLTQDQEEWSRRMVEFIDLPWDPACLEYHRSERAILTFSKWQARQKIHRRSVERWRHYEPFIGPLLGLAKHHTQSDA
jgi:hypothetical protein